MSKSALSAGGITEDFHCLNFYLRYRSDYHLGNAHTAMHDKNILTDVSQNHVDFTAIIRINRTRGIR